ncbi:MAG TPA: RNA methyltransferase [Propionibacteriaceae bacterium]|nr:RNA methyltransferase [Propionibacteriaceae bacterium]
MNRHEPTLNEAIDLAAASQGTLRSARRLLRHKERHLVQRFLAEGRQTISEALRRPGTVLELIVADDSLDRHLDLLNTASNAGVRISTAPAHAVTELAATVTPQGLIAVCEMVNVPTEEALAGNPRLVVLCDQVRDPGNLGTVIRCADAFGADAVLVSRDSVDVYNAKTVRATTGSLFHLPLAIEIDLADAVTLAREAGLQVLGADASEPFTVDDLARSGELAQPTLWVLGNEAWGLPAKHVTLLDRLVALPIYGRAESLNLSTAAAVFLYASATAQHAPAI